MFAMSPLHLQAGDNTGAMHQFRRARLRAWVSGERQRRRDYEHRRETEAKVAGLPGVIRVHFLDLRWGV